MQHAALVKYQTLEKKGTPLPMIQVMDLYLDYFGLVYFKCLYGSNLSLPKRQQSPHSLPRHFSRTRVRLQKQAWKRLHITIGKVWKLSCNFALVFYQVQIMFKDENEFKIWRQTPLWSLTRRRLCLYVIQKERRGGKPAHFPRVFMRTESERPQYYKSGFSLYFITHSRIEQIYKLSSRQVLGTEKIRTLTGYIEYCKLTKWELNGHLRVRRFGRKAFV